LLYRESMVRALVSPWRRSFSCSSPVQCMFIAKHPVTLNAAAELTPFGMTAP
jgi:hypothetical protein